MSLLTSKRVDVVLPEGFSKGTHVLRLILMLRRPPAKGFAQHAGCSEKARKKWRVWQKIRSGTHFFDMCLSARALVSIHYERGATKDRE